MSLLDKSHIVVLLVILNTLVFPSDGSRWDELTRYHGPGVCAKEQFTSKGNGKVFAIPWSSGNICGQETIVKFYCCHGYSSITGERGCPVVKPLTNLLDTARTFEASEFVRQVELQGLISLLAKRGAYTLFAAHDMAFDNLSIRGKEELEESIRSRQQPPVLLYAVVERRQYSYQLQDQISLPTLFGEAALRFRRYPNGLVTVNCIPLVAMDLEGNNGIIHLTQSLLLPPRYLTVTDLIVRQPQLSKTAAAIIQGQLTNPLREKSTVTVFAPINKAWDILAESFVKDLLADISALQDLLKYHIIDDIWCHTAATGTHTIHSINHKPLEITCNISETIVGGARLLDDGQFTGNGVVYSVDKVLLPQKVLPLTTVAENLGLNTFLELLNQTGLIENLQSRGAFTLFAPTDEAFAELQPYIFNQSANNPGFERRILEMHIALGSHLSGSLVDGLVLSGVAEESFLYVKLHRKRLSVGLAIVTDPDHEARNGVLHIIDRVLLPTQNTVGTLLLSQSNVSIFTSLLNSTNSSLLEVLDDPNTITTLFVPEDSSFEYLASGLIERLQAEPEILEMILKNHFVSDLVISGGLEPLLFYQYNTWNDRFITIREEESGSLTVANQAEVTEKDIAARNGVIHKISRLIQFS